MENNQLQLSGLCCPFCGADLYIGFDICPTCGNDIPQELLDQINQSSSPVQQPIDDNNWSLTHFEALEEESKTKIGTFEKLLRQYTTSFGFNDTDYAPLVNPLASVLEIELSLSVFDKLYPYWEIIGRTKGIDIPIREKCMLGQLTFMLKRTNSNGITIPQSIAANWEFANEHFGQDMKILVNPLEAITDVRNDADHKKVITQERFKTFIALYREFYETYMPALLQLKSMSGSYGARLFTTLRNQFPKF